MNTRPLRTRVTFALESKCLLAIRGSRRHVSVTSVMPPKSVAALPMTEWCAASARPTRRGWQTAPGPLHFAGSSGLYAPKCSSTHSDTAAADSGHDIQSDLYQGIRRELTAEFGTEHLVFQVQEEMTEGIQVFKQDKVAEEQAAPQEQEGDISLDFRTASAASSTTAVLPTTIPFTDKNPYPASMDSTRFSMAGKAQGYGSKATGGKGG
ncbi:hypothetical protein CBR_g86010, partial [Chara braunii]